MGHQPLVGFGGPHIANTCSVAAVSPRRRVPLVRQGGGRREKTVLATKLYSDMGEWPNDGKPSALNIRRALDASLTRLQTDYIDLHQFHHVDRATPWDEIWQAIDVAVAAGKILTSTAATSRAGTSPRPRKPLGAAALAGRCARCRPQGQARTLPIAAGVDGQPAHLRGLGD